jgi:hypothetical protein
MSTSVGTDFSKQPLDRQVQPPPSPLEAKQAETPLSTETVALGHTSPIANYGKERDTERREPGWAGRRAQAHSSEKVWMAKYCVEHDFLLIDGNNPASSRDTVASILVNSGTTPNVVVREALEWIKRNWKQSGPFDVTWYTTGGLVNATLRDFRESNRETNFEQSIAAQIFLFPGRVNSDMQAVSGPEAEKFVNDLDIDFTYAFLSVFAFDLESGRTRFQYSEEVALQSACARLYADHKFLFIDSSKFRRDGKHGYDLSDLLAKSKTVTIYTTSSSGDRDKVIKERCAELAEKLLPNTNAAPGPARRTLRLRIVGPSNALAEAWQHEGDLKSDVTSPRSRPSP